MTFKLHEFFRRRDILQHLQNPSSHLYDNLNVETSSGYFSFTSSLALEFQPLVLGTFTFLAHIRNLEKSFFSMNGNFTFPHWHDFRESFKERIFSSSLNQFFICFWSVSKLLQVWLMFFPFSKYQLITFSFNSLQNALRLVGVILNSLSIVKHTMK